MKLRSLLVVIAFLSLSLPSLCQEVYWQKSFSLELGTGFPPLHASMSPSRDAVSAMAQQGIKAERDGAFYPVLSLSGAWRVSERSELLLTAGATWCYHKITQFEPFGIDPDGNPRYDLNKSVPAGRKNSTLIPSLSVRYRYVWNPDRRTEVYSGAGIGFTTYTDILPLPELVPVAVRIRGNHIYGFVELTMGPVASGFHGGLGWRF